MVACHQFALRFGEIERQAVGFRQSGFASLQSYNPVYNPRLFLKARDCAERVAAGRLKMSAKEKERLNRAAGSLLKRLQDASGAA